MSKGMSKVYDVGVQYRGIRVYRCLMKGPRGLVFFTWGLRGKGLHLSVLLRVIGVGFMILSLGL